MHSLACKVSASNAACKATRTTWSPDRMVCGYWTGRARSYRSVSSAEAAAVVHLTASSTHRGSLNCAFASSPWGRGCDFAERKSGRFGKGGGDAAQPLRSRRSACSMYAVKMCRTTGGACLEVGSAEGGPASGSVWSLMHGQHGVFIVVCIHPIRASKISPRSPAIYPTATSTSCHLLFSYRKALSHSRRVTIQQ